MKIKTLMAAMLLAQSITLTAEDYETWPVPAAPLCEMSTTPTQTYFSLWSPRAKAVEVTLYEDGQSKIRLSRFSLTPHSDGIWSITVPRNLQGKFYTFTVTDEKGNLLEETPGIFAKAVGVNGQRAQVLDLATTNPDGWSNDVRPTLQDASDAVIYEMHHRDFSIDEESGIAHRGKFLALTERGTKTATGEPTGLDHLVDLGVTHVHLLPSYDFGSVDETKLDQPQYNWGYDPVNYNVPEGSYSTNPYDPAVRIREFKQMVMSLHKAGIRVVLDVVYNHVFDLKTSNFERTAPGYFFRWNTDGTPSNGSGCGNETASNRPMMRKFMIESVLYWAHEYHIDGFRFDLMGIHDLETMNAIREAVNSVDPSILIYGEGWAAGTPNYPQEKLAMKANVGQLPSITAFGDEMRDGLRGGWDNDKNGAFLIGKPGNEESIKFGLAGAVEHSGVDMQKVNYSKQPWAKEPTQMISYVSCHDDMCLADRIATTLKYQKSSKKAQKVDPAECVRLQKLAYATVMASRGIPFLWCGDEMMRNRHGVHNCYNSPDSINAIPWRLMSEHQDVYNYIKGIIALRKQYQWQKQTLTFLPVKNSNLIVCQYGDDLIILLNSNRKAVTQVLPEGQWQVLSTSDGTPKLKGQTISIPQQSAVILRKDPPTPIRGSQSE